MDKHFKEYAKYLDFMRDIGAEKYACPRSFSAQVWCHLTEKLDKIEDIKKQLDYARNEVELLQSLLLDVKNEGLTLNKDPHGNFYMDSINPVIEYFKDKKER